MSVSIRLKHSGVAAKAPLPSDLAAGELGLNIHKNSPAVYLKDSAGVIRKVGGPGTEPHATETVRGVAEIATQAEVNTGTDNTRIVTPLHLKAAVPAATETKAGKAEIATQGEVNAGTNDNRIVTPLKLKHVNTARDTANNAKFVNVAGDTMTGNLSVKGTVAATTTVQSNNGTGNLSALQHGNVSAVKAAPGGTATFTATNGAGKFDGVFFSDPTQLGMVVSTGGTTIPNSASVTLDGALGTGVKQNVRINAAHGGELQIRGGTRVAFNNGVLVKSNNNTCADLAVVATGSFMQVTSVAGQAYSVPLTLSDVNLKKDIKLTGVNAADRIKSMRFVSYAWKREEMGPKRVELGLVAQELEAISPSLITDMGEHKGLDLTNLIHTALKAVQETLARVESLEAEVKALKAS